MSIREVHNSVFNVPAHTRVITINLVGAAGAGVAGFARDNIPGFYTHYRKMYKRITPEQFIAYTHDAVLYLMIPTKIDWRDNSPKELVLSNLNRLAVITREHPERFGTIALPPMGCGNGGLKWHRDVRPEAYRLFEDHPSEVIVCL